MSHMGNVFKCQLNKIYNLYVTIQTINQFSIMLYLLGFFSLKNLIYIYDMFYVKCLHVRIKVMLVGKIKLF
jgi:hypothetical protein